MSAHRESISTRLAALGRTDVPCSEVEAWMRLGHGTLSHLDPATFDAEVRLAVECHDHDPAESKALAESFGLKEVR